MDARQNGFIDQLASGCPEEYSSQLSEIGTGRMTLVKRHCSRKDAKNRFSDRKT